MHQRRLWADVRTTPDELGRYVIWDLHPGSYDRQLEWLARQRAEHDPPPLTRQRLLSWSLRSPTATRPTGAWPSTTSTSSATPGTTGTHHVQTAIDVDDPDDPDYRAWHETYLTAVGAATRDAVA